MTKRAKLRTAAFVCALFLVLCGLWASTAGTLENTKMKLEYSYRRALGDLADHVSGMESALQKAAYVNTATMQSSLSAELLEKSSGAKAAMAALPLPSEKEEKLNRFLSQTGDYALALMRSSTSGKKQTAEDLENLSILSEYAGKLSSALQSAQARARTEGVFPGSTGSALQSLDTVSSLPELDNDFDEASKELSEIPALLYDGPFSDHVSQRKPLSLEGTEEINEEEAARLAADFLGCPVSSLQAAGPGGDALPVFSFFYEDSHTAITRQGGKIAYFKKEHTSGSGTLTYEDALRSAVNELDSLGITGLKETYYVISDGLCTINFASLASLKGEEQEAVCYPDLIKVTIELEQGGMVECDCTGYLMNHRGRTLSLPEVTLEEAEENVNPRLRIQGSTLALIPTPGLYEVLCWEFLCESEVGQEFLVYINGETGLEEQFYLLQRSDNGVLVS